MNWLQAAKRARAASLTLSVASLVLTLAGCIHAPSLNPLEASGVNPDSTVAAEVVAASRTTGPYPHFSQVPAIPTDVRPVSAWRASVLSEWGQKRQTEHEDAVIPFTLANTEAWAQRTRLKIPADETAKPTPNATEETEAYAAAERARATPPPPPQ